MDERTYQSMYQSAEKAEKAGGEGGERAGDTMAGRVDGGVRVTFDEGEVLALFDCDAARADVVGRRDERALLEAAGDRKYVGGHGRRSPWINACLQGFCR